ncbi:MAG: glycosyltransferase family 2 protein [Candidatus Staskawiczbacteria bacterium]|nr:glycosyltransferase family 2 protein [Candidatus Staskawiczbacteria bacterium]
MEKKDYLDISKASDIKNPTERGLYRFFEMIPGILSLGTLFGVLVLSWLIPSWVAVFIICFCFYYLFRIFYFSLHQIFGYFKVRSNMKRDWLRELKKIKGQEGKPNWKDIYHIIIFPAYKESREIIEESMGTLLKADYPKEKMIVVLSVEQRAGKAFEDQAKEIAKKYSGSFYKFLVTAHPDGVAGEISGKGSNTSYAGKEVKGKIIDELKIPYENVLISTFDIDTKAFSQYFSCLTWHYLTEPNPIYASYQPVPVYNNNIWSASFFSRVVSTSNTFWQMIQQERSEKLTTYSSHTTPAKVFFDVGYPANVVSDDSRIFWKAYLQYDGNYRVVPIYYLVSMDAVMASNFWRTIVNQYKQQKRWAWGCAEIPYMMFGFLNNKKISVWQKIGHLYTILDGFWSWATAALLLFLLGWLPILLGGHNFNFSVLSFNLPILTSQIMTVSMVGMFVSAILSTMLLPPVPKKFKWYIKIYKKSTVFLQWVLLPITLILFGSLPSLDAQIRLMLGRYMGFWVTEKVRK